MSDLIDRQAVIDLLKQMRKDGDMVPWEGKDVFARIRKLPTIQPEKAQLSKEGTTKDTTSDTISKTETVEHLRRMLEATVPNTDYDEGYVDGVEVGISTVSTMPTIQPQSITGQLNDGARSTNLIDRQAALDALDKRFDNIPMEQTAEILMLRKDLRELPTIQPVATDTNVGDTISRQWLMECVNEGWIKFDTEKDENRFIHLVRDIAPPIQPEPHEGEWINTNPEYKNGFYNNSYYCSECHDYYTTSPYEMKFCPNCGAKMKGVKHETD